MNAPHHSFNSFAEPFSMAPGRSSAVMGAPSLASILEKAKDLRPYLRERGQETELNRRISEETTQILKILVSLNFCNQPGMVDTSMALRDSLI